MIALIGSTMSWQMREATSAVSFVFSIMARSGIVEAANIDDSSLVEGVQSRLTRRHMGASH
jgi:hypothetical protein